MLNAVDLLRRGPILSLLRPRITLIRKNQTGCCLQAILMAGISNMPLGNSIDFPTSLGTRRKGTRGEDTVVKVAVTYGVQHPNLIVGLHRAPYTVTPIFWGIWM